MDLFDLIGGAVVILAPAVGIPLACHLCIRSYWRAVGCGLLLCLTVWVGRLPTVALAGAGLAGLLLVLARSRWKAATSWLVPAAVVGWCAAAALTAEQPWVMLLSAPAIAPMPAMVGIFVAAYRQDWSAVKWGRIATIALAVYSIWWWADLYPTLSWSVGYLSAIPIAIDVVILVAVPFSFLELSLGEWRALGVAWLVLLALAQVWVSWETTGSHSSLRLNCEMGVRQIMLFALEYSYAHDGSLPMSLSVLSPEYHGDFDQLKVCPWAHSRGIPAEEDGYEYAGAGLRLSDRKDQAGVPMLFDRAGNHRDHTRSVLFTNETVGEYTEREFRALLLSAVSASAYPQATVEDLKKQEPWLGEAMAKGK